MSEKKDVCMNYTCTLVSVSSSAHDIIYGLELFASFAFPSPSLSLIPPPFVIFSTTAAAAASVY